MAIPNVNKLPNCVKKTLQKKLRQLHRVMRKYIIGEWTD